LHVWWPAANAQHLAQSKQQHPHTRRSTTQRNAPRRASPEHGRLHVHEWQRHKLGDAAGARLRGTCARVWRTKAVWRFHPHVCVRVSKQSGHPMGGCRPAPTVSCPRVHVCTCARVPHTHMRAHTCRSLSVSRWRAHEPGLSKCPNMMVEVVRRPTPCAAVGSSGTQRSEQRAQAVCERGVGPHTCGASVPCLSAGHGRRPRGHTTDRTCLHHVHPLPAAELVWAQRRAHAVTQHLRCCAGQAAQPRCLELRQVGWQRQAQRGRTLSRLCVCAAVCVCLMRSCACVCVCVCVRACLRVCRIHVRAQAPCASRVHMHTSPATPSPCTHTHTHTLQAATGETTHSRA
jgi:hypothetical protein